jgi:hypothetical protein
MQFILDWLLYDNFYLFFNIINSLPNNLSTLIRVLIIIKLINNLFFYFYTFDMIK